MTRPDDPRAGGPTHVVEPPVRAPWSLATSCLPGGLRARRPPPRQPHPTGVTQEGGTARVEVTGRGDLDAAAEKVARFLALDVDARGWPDVGDRDPVVPAAQRALPGVRPCASRSPDEAAAWAVLPQRVRISRAARLRTDLVARHGDDGAFPAPSGCVGSTSPVAGPSACLHTEPTEQYGVDADLADVAEA